MPEERPSKGRIAGSEMAKHARDTRAFDLQSKQLEEAARNAKVLDMTYEYDKIRAEFKPHVSEMYQHFEDTMLDRDPDLTTMFGKVPPTKAIGSFESMNRKNQMDLDAYTRNSRVNPTAKLPDPDPDLITRLEASTTIRQSLAEPQAKAKLRALRQFITSRSENEMDRFFFHNEMSWKNAMKFMGRAGKLVAGGLIVNDVVKAFEKGKKKGEQEAAERRN